ncbi:polymorphic toxin-type HINT domain-containing protein [Paenibacillus tarimensis]|uniref:polymorphic toxin-type HINT domain-containing protein n=2 Tax=Paenibacillus tarimensis TaxID=416012 RepID=UPI0039EFB634
MKKVRQEPRKTQNKNSSPCNCFTAGTKVLTDEREKNIEDIEVGDMVLAKDENNPDGELAYKEVTHLYRNDKEIIYELTVGDQVIETTDNHPFWVEGEGWVLAADLQAGDKLQQSNGDTLTIAKISIVKHDELVKVYNFTVADFHTYYVSDLGIWVHNTGCDIISPFDLVGRQTKDEMTGNKIKKIAKNMKQNGWDGEPIKVYVVKGKTIIVDGHHRATAAKQAGLKNVPIEYVSEAELKSTWRTTPDELLRQTYEAGGR